MNAGTVQYGAWDERLTHIPERDHAEDIEEEHEGDGPRQDSAELLAHVRPLSHESRRRLGAHASCLCYSGREAN